MARASDQLLPHPKIPQSSKTAPQLEWKCVNIHSDAGCFPLNRALPSQVPTLEKEVCDVIYLCSQCWEAGKQSPPDDRACPLQRPPPKDVFFIFYKLLPTWHRVGT